MSRPEREELLPNDLVSQLYDAEAELASCGCLSLAAAVSTARQQFEVDADKRGSFFGLGVASP